MHITLSYIIVLKPTQQGLGLVLGSELQIKSWNDENVAEIKPIDLITYSTFCMRSRSTNLEGLRLDVAYACSTYFSPEILHFHGDL
jgi:hypothetical protein